MRTLAALALLLGIGTSGPSTARYQYAVTNNPYAGVTWATTLRCQTQTHDHINTAGMVQAYDTAGYCGVTFMDYSGGYATDGTCIGWCGERYWPATDFGAPAINTLTNVKLYLPGAEEIGLLASGSQSAHVGSPFMTAYLEGYGCATCGPGGTAVPAVPAGTRYTDSQQLIDLVNANGGWSVLNHPAGWDLSRFKAVEVFNNYHQLRDEKNGTTQVATMRAIWDTHLDMRSARIWGVAVNDHYGPNVVPGTVDAATPALTATNIDRGKIQVFTADYALATVQAAFEAGAFVAVNDNAATKGAYPQITGVTVSAASIVIATQDAATVRWYSRGLLVGTGNTLSLALPPSLRYVRAEIEDTAGRVVYVQPFELARN